jgi:hypothetical protein
MRLQFKIRSDLLNAIQSDLDRPHPFAAERVGFVLTKTARGRSGTSVLATDYIDLPDKEYIPDNTVGARINQEAIRKALNAALIRRCGVFHIHKHHFGKFLWFSDVDLIDQNRSVPDFFTVRPDQFHGSIVLSQTSMTGLAWANREKSYPFTELCEVGQTAKVIRPRSDGVTEFSYNG